MPPVRSATIRVGHVVALYLAQTETFIHTQLVGLAASEAVVFTLRVENLEQFPVDVPVVRYKLTPSAGWPIRLARKLGREAGLYRRLVNAPEYSLTSLTRRERVGILHAHFAPNGYLAIPAARALRVPLVTSFYGYDASTLPHEPGWRRSLALLFRAGSRFLAEGPAMAARLAALGCPREKIAVVPIAIDLGRYRFQRRSRVPADRPVRLLFVGRLVEKKGAKYAIMAAREVMAAGIRASLDIVGEGPLRDDLAALVGANGLERHVRFLGTRTHAEVIELLGSSDVLLAPSVTGTDGDSEGGAPTILLEAQASGVPVVSTTHADIPAVTVPGRSALLGQEGNGPEFAALVVRVCSQTERWAEMGEEGAAFVRSRHGLEGVRARLREVYLSVGRPGARRSTPRSSGASSIAQ